jgi:hypothetical protein
MSPTWGPKQCVRSESEEHAHETDCPRVSFILVMVVLTRWNGFAQQDDSRFTGRTDVLESKELGISRRSFEPGARSAFQIPNSQFPTC